MNPSSPVASEHSAEATRSMLPVWAAVFLSFFLFAAIRSPVPASNEPHYLTKARHYVDQKWCRDDFFLDSSNTHAVFYRLVGPVVVALDFESAAWAGRVVTFALLAASWVILSSRLLGGTWVGLWTAWIFLAFQSVGNFSGEWLLVGVEAKVVAYACVFLAVPCLLNGRLLLASVALGLAVSFHPVVGIWSVACALFANAALWIIFRGERAVHSLPRSAVRSIKFLRMLGAVALFAATATPGLIPAVRLLGGVPVDLAAQADVIQVYYRLGHHLNPRQFEVLAYLGYAALLLLWMALRLRNPGSFGEKWFTWFVISSLIIAVAGLLIGWSGGAPSSFENPSWAAASRAKLLKFYPFRLFDLLLPMAVAISLVGSFRQWRTANVHVTSRGRSLPKMVAVSTMVVAGIVMLAWPSSDRNPSRMRPQRLADWIQACRWIEENLPNWSSVFTPQESWAFKWYAQRAEYVSFKDCPQDAAGIVEWYRRLQAADEWRNAVAEGEDLTSATIDMSPRTKSTHVILERPTVEPNEKQHPWILFQNRTYAIYETPGTVRDAL